ncbi:MAG: alginate export family protein [Xanthomonadaceae bacterium]|nr:alginate export family protein [Xanthomonadaceae bacterium]
MRYRIAPLALACALAYVSVHHPAFAADPPPPLSFEWDLRARHERVADDAFSPTADAATLRLRAGLRAEFGGGWSALLEAEGIADTGDGYNSGANGETKYPAVIDPEGMEWNQAWVGWKNPQVGATVGRQRLMFDNQRWIGNVGWRQNEQTFDAAEIEVKPGAAWTLRYAWLDRAHRVSGDDARDPLARERDLSTHLLNAAFKHGKQQWTGYAYLHDDRDLAAASSATYGVRWTGTLARSDLTWSWSAEAAEQRDYADNPRDFSHRYWLLEPSLQAHGIAYKLGWEHLGGDGRHALQTPLATLHAFNGWADKFLVTPAGGIEDAYASVGGKAGKYAWVTAYHDYRADTPFAGIDRYGREANLSISRPLRKGWAGMFKYADYRADDFARDTRKLWLQVEWKGSAPLIR